MTMTNRDKWCAEPDPEDNCCFVDLDGTVRCILCRLDCQDDSCSCPEFRGGAPKGWPPVAVRYWRSNMPLHPIRWSSTRIEVRGADGFVIWTKDGGDPIHSRWRLADESDFGPTTPPTPPPWVRKRCGV